MPTAGVNVERSMTSVEITLRSPRTRAPGCIGDDFVEVAKSPFREYALSRILYRYGEISLCGLHNPCDVEGDNIPWCSMAKVRLRSLPFCVGDAQIILDFLEVFPSSKPRHHVVSQNADRAMTDTGKIT